MAHDPRCIAVFDSGIGGLTVVRALRRSLPGEDIVYFGDTARVPYGIKSPQTVLRFAREICEFLLRMNPKIIVVACNTASAAALPELERGLEIPICGVVRPGAEEAVRLAEGRLIGIIATEATVNSDAYRRAIYEFTAGLPVIQRACPLLVPMVEEGRDSSNPVVKAVVAEYLESLARLEPRVVVMGCTHYPLIREAIAEYMGPDVLLVDSGEQTARTVMARLEARGALAERQRDGALSCYVSDNPQRFRELGQRFLSEPVVDVAWISPDQFFAMETKVA